MLKYRPKKFFPAGAAFLVHRMHEPGAWLQTVTPVVLLAALVKRCSEEVIRDLF